jgi:hypothetical protein
MRRIVGLAPVVEAVQNLATNGLRIAFNRLLALVVNAVHNLATNGLRVAFNRLLAPIVGLEPTTLGLTVPRSTS